MNVKDLKGQTIACAASGGVDSCTITHWLTEHGVKVVAFTADLAQPDETDFGAIEKRMRACGAVDYVGLPLQKEMAEIGIEGIQAQTCYEGRYWATTPFGRQVTTVGIVSAMKKKGLKIFSHGATGRGNDQVRFQVDHKYAGTFVQRLRTLARRSLSESLQRADSDDRILRTARTTDQGVARQTLFN